MHLKRTTKPDRRLNSLIKQMNCVVIGLTADGSIQEFNAKAEAAFNWKRKEVLHENLFDLSKKHKINLPVTNLTQLLSGKPLKNKISAIHRKNKSDITLQWVILPTLSKKKSDVQVLMLGLDISACQTSSKKESELSGYLNNIINNIPHFIFWKDTNSVFLGCNKKFADSVGLPSPKNIVGKTDHDMPWKKEQTKIYRKDDKEIISTGIGKLNYEERQRQADGSEMIVLVSKVPMFSEQGKIIGILGIYTDITERKKFEEELKEAKERAEAANRAKSEFLAAVSHELRIPLTGILGMAQLLSDDQLSEQKSRQVEDILTAGSHLLELVNDLLDLSKLEAGKLELHLAPVDLHKLIEEIATIVVFQCKTKGLDLRVDYAVDVPYRVISDARVLRQIMLNLIGNAIKFTEQGYVSIKVECLEKTDKRAKLLFLVEDTGIGIPKDKQAAIFDRFNQVDSSRTRRYGGAGLGLTITKAYVVLMGGNITVDSDINKGSKFICHIPFALPKVSHLVSPWENYKSKVRVMIVEDSLHGEVIAKHLNSSLCQVIPGVQAFNTLLAAQQNKQPFDIVIIDQELRETDALELAHMIAHQNSIKQLPLLMLLSSSATLATREIAKEAGFQQVLLKPVQPTELLTSLTAAWEHWIEYKGIKKLSVSDVGHSDLQQQLSVLLVEDDPIVQRVHSMMLERMGCKVDVADTGEKVLKLFNENKGYDIIFMDVGLPNMSGMDITKTIRRLEGGKTHVPIVGITGYGHEEDRNNCFAAGMDDVAVKPVPTKEIRRLLQKWVTKQVS